jgi:hypothetical protein
MSPVPLIIRQDPHRSIRQLSSKRSAIAPPPKKPKNKSDGDDYDDDPYYLKVAWLPGDVF